MRYRYEAGIDLSEVTCWSKVKGGQAQVKVLIHCTTEGSHAAITSA
jgi:hypothetical protein